MLLALRVRSPVMDKSLEHARLLYYLVMGAAIVALVLAFTKHGDLSERYDLAIKEMTIVRGLVGHDWKEGGDTARNIYEPRNLSTIQGVRENLTKRAGVFASSRLGLDLKASPAMPLREEIEFRWDVPFVNRLDLPITTTINDILLHFNAIPILAVKPQIDELVSKSKGLRNPPKGTNLIDIKVVTVVDLSAYFSASGWRTAPTQIPAKVTMRFFTTGDSLLLEEKANVAAQIERLPPFSQRDVLLRSYRYFHQVLPLVEDYTPDQALFYLKEKASNVPSSASFIGVSVPRSMILITAGSILGLLLIFSRSLLHIELSLPSNQESLKALRNFSWILLFNDNWSRYFSQFSILVLPTAAVASLGWSSLLSLSSSPSLIGIALLLVATGTSLTLSQSALSIIDTLQTQIIIADAESSAVTVPDEG